MAIKGNDIIILRGSTAIAATTTNEIEAEVETIEKSSPTSGVWKEYVTGQKGWKVDVNFLLAQVSTLTEALNVGTSYTLVMRDRSSSASLTGTAILRTCKITATKGNLVQGSFSFIGSGTLS